VLGCVEDVTRNPAVVSVVVATDCVWPDTFGTVTLSAVKLAVMV